jgi:signal peptidase I
MSYNVVQTLESASLFQDLLDKDIILRVRVTGKSMVPFLRGEEVVTLKKVPASSLHRGDLIFFRDRYGSFILHRIIRKKKSGGKVYLETKGDALIAFDEPVLADDVLGKVCGVEKKISGEKISYRDMTSGFWRSINLLMAFISLGRSKIYGAILSH